MDQKSRLTFGPFCIRRINDNDIYCRAWKKLFRCLYDHDPRPPEAKMGNLSHKSGGRTEKADFRSLPTNKTQKGARESRNDIKSYGTLKLPVQTRCATVCEDLAAQTSSPFFRSSYGRDHRIWVAAKNRDIVLQQ